MFEGSNSEERLGLNRSIRAPTIIAPTTKVNPGIQILYNSMLTSQCANSSSHVNDTATSEIDDTVTIKGIGSECAHPTRRCPTPLIKNIKLHHFRVLLI